MKLQNFIIALIAAFFYNLSVMHLNPFPYGLFAALLISLIITGIIMIFKKDKNTWGSVFMWSTIIISLLAGIGNNLN